MLSGETTNVTPLFAFLRTRRHARVPVPHNTLRLGAVTPLYHRIRTILRYVAGLVVLF